MNDTSSKPLYSCSACSLGVLIIDGKTIAACKCNAPILANASATMRGTSGMKVTA